MKEATERYFKKANKILSTPTIDFINYIGGSNYIFRKISQNKIKDFPEYSNLIIALEGAMYTLYKAVQKPNVAALYIIDDIESILEDIKSQAMDKSRFWVQYTSKYVDELPNVLNRVRKSLGSVDDHSYIEVSYDMRDPIYDRNFTDVIMLLCPESPLTDDDKKELLTYFIPIINCMLDSLWDLTKWDEPLPEDFKFVCWPVFQTLASNTPFYFRDNIRYTIYGLRFAQAQLLVTACPSTSPDIYRGFSERVLTASYEYAMLYTNTAVDHNKLADELEKLYMDGVKRDYFSTMSTIANDVNSAVRSVKEIAEKLEEV